jgi:Kef-type K+ transport system membrane component KefB
MSRNAVHAGCLTGVAVVAILFYPLYVVLPGSYVADWQAGSASLGLILSIVAAVVPMAGGLLAGRGTERRRKGAMFGALAGGIAGTMAFAALGAAAAGTDPGAGCAFRGVFAGCSFHLLQHNDGAGHIEVRWARPVD